MLKTRLDFYSCTICEASLGLCIYTFKNGFISLSYVIIFVFLICPSVR